MSCRRQQRSMKLTQPAGCHHNPNSSLNTFHIGKVMSCYLKPCNRLRVTLITMAAPVILDAIYCQRKEQLLPQLLAGRYLYHGLTLYKVSAQAMVSKSCRSAKLRVPKFKRRDVIWIVTELEFHAPSPPLVAHELLVYNISYL